MPVSLLKSMGSVLFLSASLVLASAGCSSSPLKTSSGPLDLFTKPFSAKKKSGRSNLPDTIPSASAAGYTPNE